MARSFTVGTIIDRALKKADMYNSGFIEADEAMDLFNAAYAELYDLLIQSSERYFVEEEEIVTSGGTLAYDLPDDFYKMVGVDFKVGESDFNYITLKPFNENERNGVYGQRGDIPSGTVRIRYNPAPTIFTSRDETVDGISGWEELIVVNMAIEMLSKEESSTTRLERQQAKLTDRIESMSEDRDLSMPGRVNDVNSIDYYQQYAALRYQVSANTLRFLSTEIVGPGLLGYY